MARTSPKVKRVIICGIIGAFFTTYVYANNAVYPLIVLVFFALLFGIFGLMSGPVQTPVKEKNEREPFQFSLARLLLVTTNVAIVFGITKILFGFEEPVEIVLSSILAILVGAVTLICKKRDVKQIILTILLGIILIGLGYSAYLFH